MKKNFLPLLLFLVSLCQAQTPILWGMTKSGGVHDSGTIFSYNVASNSETFLKPLGINYGWRPSGSLLKATNGLLYGMTDIGGPYVPHEGAGLLFSLDIYTDTETPLHYFGNANDTDGAFPAGSLIQVNDSLLYGMTSQGGAYYDGTIFSYNISNGVETVLHSFGSDSDGQSPEGSLTQASNGLLYGFSWGGDQVSDNFGIIFSYDISNGNYSIVHKFPNTGIDGAVPMGSLIQANDGLLYGMTSSGGTNDVGTIISYNITTGHDSVLFNFEADEEGQMGQGPFGSLIQASNGLLYGMSQWGGGGVINFYGEIFSYDIVTGVYTDEHDFSNNGIDGYTPYGSLIQASDGLLYGMTSNGGSSDSGTIFRYNISTSTETVIHAFTGANGANPHGDLIEVDFPTSIPQLTASHQLQISPNPSTGQFIVQLPGNQSNYPADIYNTLGQKIQQLTLTNTQNTLNLTNQSTGMYFVYLQTENGPVTGKVMVVR